VLFEALDFLYVPSADVAAEVAYFTDVLGAELVFAIEAMGTRVAMLELSPGPPRIVLADHLDGDMPILVYRVADLAAAQAELEGRGWRRQTRLEIPQGPVASFRTPGGQRIALYQLTRPDVLAHFKGRRAF
jgi:catechol 2,3-dioxygenase-like lactoylglutathione lyase family enzyme